jgi:hypothetical protein
VLNKKAQKIHTPFYVLKGGENMWRKLLLAKQYKNSNWQSAAWQSAAK